MDAGCSSVNTWNTDPQSPFTWEKHSLWKLSSRRTNTNRAILYTEKICPTVTYVKQEASWCFKNTDDAREFSSPHLKREVVPFTLRSEMLMAVQWHSAAGPHGSTRYWLKLHQSTAAVHSNLIANVGGHQLCAKWQHNSERSRDVVRSLSYGQPSSPASKRDWIKKTIAIFIPSFPGRIRKSFQTNFPCFSKVW